MKHFKRLLKFAFHARLVTSITQFMVHKQSLAMHKLLKTVSTHLFLNTRFFETSKFWNYAS